MNKLILYISNSKFVRIVLFFLFFSTLLIVFSNVTKDTRDQKLLHTLTYLKSKPNKNFDIMFFSNSYLFTAYNPMYLKYLTGYNSIHFGTSARKFCFEPTMIKEVLRIQKPKLIVVDISAGILKKPEGDSYIYHNSRGFSSLDFSLLKSLAIVKYLPKNRWFQTASLYSNVPFQLSSIFSETDHISYPNSKNGGIYGFVGLDSSSLNEKEYEKKYDSIYTLTPSVVNNKLTIDNESVKELNSLIEFIRKRPDTQILFINGVKINSKYENQVFIDSLENSIKDYKNISLLSLNTPESKKALNLKFDDFWSNDHLQTKGALKVTKYFSSFLKNNLKLDNSVKNLVDVFKFESKNNSIIKVKYKEVLSNQHFSSTICLIIEKDSRVDYDNIATGINVYPKKGFEKLLSKSSIEKKAKVENLYMPLTKYHSINGDLIAFIQNTSHLDKSQIDYIEYWFWDTKNKVSTNREKIRL